MIWLVAYLLATAFVYAMVLYWGHRDCPEDREFNRALALQLAVCTPLTFWPVAYLTIKPIGRFIMRYFMFCFFVLMPALAFATTDGNGNWTGNAPEMDDVMAMVACAGVVAWVLKRGKK